MRRTLRLACNSFGLRPPPNGASQPKNCSVVVAGLAIALGCGCTAGPPATDATLPPLVIVSGYANVPNAYKVSAIGQTAPQGMAVLLGPLGGSRSQAIAIGRVVSSDGFYSLSLPAPTLQPIDTGYELRLSDPSDRPLFTSLVVLSNNSQSVSQDIDGATTVVALAARQAAASGRSVSAWSVASLARLGEVTKAANSLSFATDIWAASPSASPSALSADYVTDLNAGVTAVLNAAP